MGKHKSKGDVYWYVQNRKRPIAHSAVAVSDSLSMINTPHTTPNNLTRMLKSGAYVGVNDEIRVVQAYIDDGHGDEILNTR
jgi:hypothetical protein